MSPSPRSFFLRPTTSIVAVAILGACHSGASGGPPAPTPAAIASVPADLRMVGSETTYVARGDAFEISARSKRDLAVVLPQLQRADSVYRQMFGAQPAYVQIAVAHPMPLGESSTASTTPVLPREGTPLVTIELMVPGDMRGDRNARSGDRPSDNRDGRDRGEGRQRGDRGDMRAPGVGREAMGMNPLRPVARAWLSSRASTLTSHAGTIAQSAGETSDPRVPAWAESALMGLTADSARIFMMSRQLMATDSIYPLAQFFTMLRPPNVFREMARAEGRGEGERRPGGGGMGGGGMGGMGGRGGRGGMGGMGGGMGGGRGGMGGRGGEGGRGGSGGGSGAAPMPGLAGGQLFDAEAAVFSHYLAVREGLPFVGSIIEAQMVGKPAIAPLGSAKVIPTDLPRLDEEWRRWMAYQVRAVNAR